MDGTYEGSPAERSGRVGDEAAEQLQGGHEDAALWAPGQSLRAAERLLLACAQTGTDFGFGGTPGLDTAVGWEPERTLRAAVLRHLLTRPEWPVTGDGVRIRGARIIGALDLQGEVMRCALFLDGCYLDGPGPLMLQHTTGSEISLRDCRQGAGGGVLAQWLKTSGNLDLSGSVLSGPVDLTGADIGGYLVCSAAQLPAGQDGCSLLGQHMKVGADVHLNAGFTADGSVMLDGAQIAGALIASGARLAGDRDGTALSGNWIKVSGGGMKLDRLVTANSAVSLIDADITGDLVLSGACLAANPEGRSLVGPRVTVSGNVALDEGFAASGALYLTHAHIGGALFCMGAQLGGADRDGWALQAFGAIASEVMLTRVRADGAVSLDDAQIAKDLSCDDMRITCANAHGIAFSCAGITVAGLLSQEDSRLTGRCGFWAPRLQVALYSSARASLVPANTE